MSSNFTRQLQRHQMEEALASWRDAALPKRPPAGWLRSIRGALSMSAGTLAKRMGIGERAVRKLEASEKDGTITLATLRRAAEAMNCELQYALVPRRSLQDTLMDRAREVAEAQLGPVEHSMSVEEQSVNKEHRQRHVDVIATLMVNKGQRLW